MPTDAPTVPGPTTRAVATEVDIVVFDIGNVLIEWDPRHLYRKLFPDPERMEWFLATVCHAEWNAMQDAGRTWEEAVAEAIGRHPEWEPQIRAYRERWHEMIPGPIDGTVAILERLHAQGTPVYAITNFASDTFREAQARFPFLTLFRDVVVSGDERLLKPDPRIYRLIAERCGFDLARSVFIDDMPKNVAAARAVGMQAVQFVGADDLAERRAGFGLMRPRA